MEKNKSMIVLFFLIFLTASPVLHAFNLGQLTSSSNDTSGSDNGTGSSDTLTLGTSSDEGTQKIKSVRIVEQPVEIKFSDLTKTMEIISSTEILTGEYYESGYLDVQQYKQVAVFVRPEKIFNDLVNNKKETVEYDLSAFFSIDDTPVDPKSEMNNEGWQEFGALASQPDGTSQPAFIKTATGKTAAGVLFTTLYGPYMRVRLTNLGSADSQRFRIVAYLIR